LFLIRKRGKKLSNSQILFLVVGTGACFSACFILTIVIVSRVFYFSKNNLDPINSISNFSSLKKSSKKNNAASSFIDELDFENKILERG
jgi:hypothetical protein